MSDKPKAATPSDDLLADLMNPNIPKSEREHAAVREIERLREALAEQPAQQEPVFWYRPVGDDGGYEGPIHNSAIERVRKMAGTWKPLYTTPQAQQKPVEKDAYEWGDRLNNASWAAVKAWDENIMGPMSGAVFNNIKGVVRAAILTYLDGKAAHGIKE